MTKVLFSVDLTPILPELTLTVGILILIVIDLIKKGRNGVVTATLGAILLGIVAIVSLSIEIEPGTYLFDSIVSDGMTTFFRVFFSLGAIISLGLMTASFKDESEPHLLIISSVLGMIFLAMANDIVTLFIAFELVSIPSYILAGYKRKDVRSAEAALKYVLFGAVSSGLMLYGFSLLYGLAGTTNIQIMAANLELNHSNQLAQMIGTIFVMAGLGYKLAMVPMHFWCPDVYEGSPTPVTAYFSVLPKAAGFAALLRIMPIFTTLEPTYGVSMVGLLTILAAITMTFGNLGAIWQSSLKRLLAYSSIAHAGYILMGFVVIASAPESELSRGAIVAIMMYLVVYLFMNLGSFLIVELVERKQETDHIRTYFGLGKTHPIPALLLAVFFFSLVGLPPLAGFIGKFVLFGALVKGKLFTLAIIGIANTVVSLFYYVRVIRDMFLSDPVQGKIIKTEGVMSFGGLGAMLAVITLVPTVVLGLFWGQLVEWIQQQVW